MTRNITVSRALALAAVLPFSPPSKAQDAWFTPQPPPSGAEPAILLAVPSTIGAAKPTATVTKSPPPQPPAASPSDLSQGGFRLSAGIGLTMPDSDNPPVGVSVDLLGHDPATAATPVRVAGNLPFALTSDVRTPQRQMGIGASYTLPPAALAHATLGASFDLNNYSPTDIGREGIATVRLGF
jgi:hypothetical protein